VSIPDEKLMAYADGELDAVERAQVEAAIDADPSLARRVEKHRALRSKVSSAYASVLDEPVSERLLNAVRGAPAAARDDRVVDTGRAPVAACSSRRSVCCCDDRHAPFSAALARPPCRYAPPIPVMRMLAPSTL